MPPLQPHLVPDSVSIKSLVLEVVSDRGTREAIVVKAGEVAEMGRATLLRLGFPSDPHMSARHFAVECDGAQSSVRDLGSRNGTFVNGAKVTEVTLKDGDRIDAGRSSFLIRLRRDAEPDRDDGSRPASVMTRPTKPDMEPVAGTASPVTRATGEGTVTDHRAPAPAPSIPLLEVGQPEPFDTLAGPLAEEAGADLVLLAVHPRRLIEAAEGALVDEVHREKRLGLRNPRRVEELRLPRSVAEDDDPVAELSHAQPGDQLGDGFALGRVGATDQNYVGAGLEGHQVGLEADRRRVLVGHDVDVEERKLLGRRAHAVAFAAEHERSLDDDGQLGPVVDVGPAQRGDWEGRVVGELEEGDGGE